LLNLKVKVSLQNYIFAVIGNELKHSFLHFVCFSLSLTVINKYFIFWRSVCLILIQFIVDCLIDGVNFKNCCLGYIINDDFVSAVVNNIQVSMERTICSKIGSILACIKIIQVITSMSDILEDSLFNNLLPYYRHVSHSSSVVSNNYSSIGLFSLPFLNNWA